MTFILPTIIFRLKKVRRICWALAGNGRANYILYFFHVFSVRNELCSLYIFGEMFCTASVFVL